MNSSNILGVPESFFRKPVSPLPDYLVSKPEVVLPPPEPFLGYLPATLPVTRGSTPPLIPGVILGVEPVYDHPRTYDPDSSDLISEIVVYQRDVPGQMHMFNRDYTAPQQLRLKNS